MDKFLRPEKFDVNANNTNASKEWKHWYTTFKNFLESTKPENHDKLKLLINYISPTVFELICECTTYEDAIKTLENAYSKPVNEIYARHILATRKQENGESIDQYLQSLKILSKECNFKAVTAEENRNDFIRDTFIRGLVTPHIRQRLLENSTLTLNQAVSQSRSLESAQKYSESYNFPSYQSCVNATSSSNTAGEHPNHSEVMNHVENISFNAATTQKCYFCGRNKHPRTVCPARAKICQYCKRLGHFSMVCMKLKLAKENKSTSASTLMASTPSNHSHCSTETTISDHIIASTNHPLSLSKSLVNVKINNMHATSLIDTGSSDSYLNYTFAKERKFNIHPSTGKVSMASVSLSSSINGYCYIDLEILGNVYTNFKVSLLPKLCTDLIIGHDIMKQHSKLDISFGGSKPPLSICCLTEAKVAPPLLFGNLTKNCRPIACKPRRHSEEDEKFITNEIKNLLKEGIIEESMSPWRAQVLVTKNERHRKRMVIDYSQTINKFTLLDAYPVPNIEDLVAKIAKYRVFSSIDLKSAYHQIPIADSEKFYTAFEACGRLYQFRRIPFGVTNGVACFQRTLDKIISDENLKGVFTYLDDITVCGEDRSTHDVNLRKFMSVIDKYQLTINENKSKFSQKSICLLGYVIENSTLKPDPSRLEPLLKLPVPQDISSLRRIIGMFAHYSRWIPKYSDKIRRLIDCKSFPVPTDAAKMFNELKDDIAKALLWTVSGDEQLVIETDASDIALAATLNQGGRPVAFHSRTFSGSEKAHSSVEKEAYAIIESIRKWKHFLIGRHFKIVTDQEAVSFMFHRKHSSKIKNEKIQRWKLELSCFSYDIIYRPGRSNEAADAFSRICGTTSSNKLFDLHQSLCHPGITRMYHLVRHRNLPFSFEDVKKMILSCPVCAELKPRFLKLKNSHLIKATSPLERLNIDFKGPLPSCTKNKYLLTVVDEYSRFPFAYPCKDITTASVINCLVELFSVFGMPAYIHSDRGSQFLSNDLVNFLHSKGVATSRTTPYNPEGNGQIERYNGIIWRSISLALKSKGLGTQKWEETLPDALHSIRSLLCTETNCTPHERMFNHLRRSSYGTSLPTWLKPSTSVFLKKFIRHSKYDPLVEEVELLEANPEYALIRHQDGKESTVSLKHLAPRGDITLSSDANVNMDSEELQTTVNPPSEDKVSADFQSREESSEIEITENLPSNTEPEVPTVRRSARERHPPEYLSCYEL